MGWLLLQPPALCCGESRALTEGQAGGRILGGGKDLLAGSAAGAHIHTRCSPEPPKRVKRYLGDWLLLGTAGPAFAMIHLPAAIPEHL